MVLAVGLVNGSARQARERIMQGDVECRSADEGGEPGHRFPIRNPVVVVETAQNSGECLLLKVISNFEGVAALLKRKPGWSQFMAETLQGLVSFLIGQRAGPNPLHA